MRRTSISERLDPSVIDTILAIWKENPKAELRFKEIHVILVNSKKTSRENEMKTDRYLKKLIEKDILSKKNKRYTLNIKLEEYETFSYLKELKEKYADDGLSYPFQAVSGLMTPFPHEITEIDKYCLSLIDETLGNLFQALSELKDTIIMRKGGFESAYTQDTMRCVLLSLIFNSFNDMDTSNQKLYNDLNKLPLDWLNNFLEQWKSNLLDAYGEGAELSNTDFYLDTFNKYGASDISDIAKEVEIIKCELKKSGFDVDKLSAGELKSMKLKQESNRQYNIDLGLTIKRIECFIKNGTHWEDFAILMTTPPEIMARYYRAINVVKDLVSKWIHHCKIDDELLRYFASKLLRHPLDEVKNLDKPGVSNLVGLKDKQIIEIIKYHKELMQEWINTHKKPHVKLSAKKRTLLREKK